MICKYFSRFLIFFTIIFTFLSTYSYAQVLTKKNNPPVAISLLSEKEGLSPNEPFWVALKFSMQPNWHLYWKRAGDNGFALQVEWNLPKNFFIGETLWPTPERLEYQDQVCFGYSDEVVLLVPITAPDTLSSQEKYEFSANISALACSDDTCQPFQEELNFLLTLAPYDAAITPESDDFFAKARQNMPLEPTSLMNFSATEKDGFVNLVFEPKVAFPKVKEINFFPSETSGIDYHYKPLIKENEDSWSVTFKSEENEVAPSHFQGELSIVSEEGKKQGYTLSFPLEEKNVDDVALSNENEPLPNSFLEAPPAAPSALEQNFLALIFSAFLGGILLNLMPCVLPVVSLKVLSFVKLAKENKLLIVFYSLTFTLGVLTSFLALGAILLMLREGGEIVGWGFQLQNPFFVAGLALLLFVLSLSLIGVMEIGLGVASWAGTTQMKSRSLRSDLMSSFFSGVLATFVATPCTGPFLGTAMGFAATMPAIQSLYIFAAVALGMSSPYLLLACFPSFLRFIPKPGPWMTYLKQGMGFLMLASVLWLLWVLSAHIGSEGLIITLAAFFVVSIACWIKGTWDTPITAKKKRFTARFLAFCVFCISLYLLNIACSMSTPTDENQQIAQLDTIQNKTISSHWENFDPERVAFLRKEKIPIIIDFTARWCLICQANHIALNDQQVVNYCLEKGVVRMKADWTRYDPAITKALSFFGRNSVPLYVLYKPGSEEAIILPQVLTPTIVLSYLEGL